MDNEDKIYKIDVSSLIDYGNTIDITTIGGDVGTVWLNTDVNKIYVHDGTSWNLSDVTSIVKEWEDSFPDHHRVKEMCTEYPALEKAYENFKTIYKMVEQDWKGKTKDDPPF